MSIGIPACRMATPTGRRSGTASNRPQGEAMFRKLLPLLLCFFAGAAMAQPKLIAIANFGEHPALRAAIDGFKAEVMREGLVEGKDVAFDDQHINFDRTLIPQLLTNAQSKKPAMILAVTTPVAQSSIRVVTDKSIPIVFMSVVDPVVAKIVPSWQAGSATHTGATLYPDFNASLAFVKQLLPDAKRLGVPFNPGRGQRHHQHEGDARRGAKARLRDRRGRHRQPQRHPAAPAVAAGQGRRGLRHPVEHPADQPAGDRRDHAAHRRAGDQHARHAGAPAPVSSPRTRCRTSAWARTPAASRRAS